MNTQITKLKNVIMKGDLSQLSDLEKIEHQKNVCESVGLNPLTNPFEYVKLSGKLTLYAKRDAADQLRQLHGVSITIAHQEESEGVYEVKVLAKDKHGRTDEDLGVVTIAGLRGEARANAIMKAITKAKRRVTLSICGLGFLDETEVDDIPGSPPIGFELDRIFPPDEKTPAIAAAVTGKADNFDMDVPDDDETAVQPATAQHEGIPLLFLPDQDQETIYFIDSVGWVDEYEAQMKSIVNNSEIAARQRMTDLKEFEKINAAGLASVPDGVKANLVSRRKTANKKLGVKKNG
jgi:hypothetical protein